VGKMQDALREGGVPFMRDDGLAKALAGLTSVEEIARVVQLESEEVMDDA
jgi:type II secretory ATPase GspE/PulE/Tfp pilus assembly ATPase PilB-like protein